MLEFISSGKTEILILERKKSCKLNCPRRGTLFFAVVVTTFNAVWIIRLVDGSRCACCRGHKPESWTGFYNLSKLGNRKLVGYASLIACRSRTKMLLLQPFWLVTTSVAPELLLTWVFSLHNENFSFQVNSTAHLPKNWWCLNDVKRTNPVMATVWLSNI